ncbi:Rpn family recombination-promoting nuclease/putative transposase [Erwinia phyllosphaerae]|uniref:Rpn family recombination-promoting nuclease/putative transposase n=1 Tax=Erwinia phyllosphaerae TaxID=2853256 RepID=UPI001FEE262F|nr:Rpn family recombination-promoting nuclease/putative transposase [Erwinia phyllosphaerae]MBV4367978.1 Rpn family recombination-promoting nuclease/putative transposase [Erwinia phyllosphaerae]
MKLTPTPHDAFFKQYLSHVETAKDFLRIHVPVALLRDCDLNTLRLASGSFIEDNLRSCHSDVLYALKTKDGEGYIYCLIEHQSSPDRQMSFRLMRYAIAAMQQHLDAGHKKLPLVIPILFYHGAVSPYPYTMDWLQGFSNPDLARQLYSCEFPLVDITAIADDKIITHRRVAMLELLQKHIRLRDLATLEEQLIALLKNGEIHDEQLILLVNYIVQAGQATDAEGLLRRLAQRSSKHKEILMTIAEQLEQIGLKKGLKQGRTEGAKQAKLEVARKMLAGGLDLNMVRKMTGLPTKALKQLAH